MEDAQRRTGHNNDYHPQQQRDGSRIGGFHHDDMDQRSSGGNFQNLYQSIWNLRRFLNCLERQQTLSLEERSSSLQLANNLLQPLLVYKDIYPDEILFLEGSVLQLQKKWQESLQHLEAQQQTWFDDDDDDPYHDNISLDDEEESTNKYNNSTNNNPLHRGPSMKNPNHNNSNNNNKNGHPDEKQKTDQELLEMEISEMAEQLKHSSLQMHSTLANQNKTMDEIADTQQENLDKVNMVTDKVEDRLKKRGWKHTLFTWTLLFMTLGAFTVLFLLIRTVPKRNDVGCFTLFGFWSNCSEKERAYQEYYQQKYKFEQEQEFLRQETERLYQEQLGRKPKPQPKKEFKPKYSYCESDDDKNGKCSTPQAKNYYDQFVDKKLTDKGSTDDSFSEDLIMRNKLNRHTQKMKRAHENEDETLTATTSETPPPTNTKHHRTNDDYDYFYVKGNNGRAEEASDESEYIPDNDDEVEEESVYKEAKDEFEYVTESSDENEENLVDEEDDEVDEEWANVDEKDVDNENIGRQEYEYNNNDHVNVQDDAQKDNEKVRDTDVHEENNNWNDHQLEEEEEHYVKNTCDNNNNEKCRSEDYFENVSDSDDAETYNEEMNNIVENQPQNDNFARNNDPNGPGVMEAGHHQDYIHSHVIEEEEKEPNNYETQNENIEPDEYGAGQYTLNDDPTKVKDHFEGSNSNEVNNNIEQEDQKNEVINEQEKLSLHDQTNTENRVNDKNEVPLNFNQNDVALAATQGRHLDLIRYLRLQPQMVFAKDANGWQPIHEAARAGSLRCVQTLVEFGADINARTGRNDGGSVLWWAERSLPDDTRTSTFFYYLRSHGAQSIPPSS